MKMAAIGNLEANAADIVRILRVLANKERVRILCRLAASKEELPIAALTLGVKISQSALSQHLTKLRKRGIISSRRVGHNSFYQLVDPQTEQLVNALPKVLHEEQRILREIRPRGANV